MYLLSAVVAHVSLTVNGGTLLELNAYCLNTSIFNGAANTFNQISLAFCAVCKAYFGNFPVRKAESKIVRSIFGKTALYPRCGGQLRSADWV
jgi:hypothetical protein